MAACCCSCQQVIQKVDEFKPQELANVVWAFASMEHHDPELMNVVGRRALVMVDQFKEQELSNVVWAFAKLHHHEPATFSQLLRAVHAKLPQLLPQVRRWLRGLCLRPGAVQACPAHTVCSCLLRSLRRGTALRGLSALPHMLWLP